ncbi:MAG TPA: ABC transporter ATP-binding protein [Candidatus Dormibacteraeota bacterium]|nr:ABC transporter ATP-binding protein [Candidatus Dormibacteraeota bacterium]
MNQKPAGRQGLASRLRRAPGRGVLAFSTERKIPYLLFGIALIIFPLVDPYSPHVDFVADAGRWILLALGLNIVVGYAGLLDLGYAAFFAIGSYAFAMVASPQFGIHISFWFCLFASAFVAAFFGLLLGAPTLRLRGDYLAIVTLGFGEIVPRVFRNASKFTGGVNGIVGVDQPKIPSILGLHGFSFGFNPVPYYYLMLVIIILCIFLINNLRNSRLGRAWMAIREDEVAAAATGINTVTTKLLAFALGASFSGFAGTYYASKLFIVTPEAFSFVVSVTVLLMVVLGGMGNMRGVIVGAVLIYFIQAYLLVQLPGWIASATAALNIGFLNSIDVGGYVQRSTILIFGIILVVIMLLRPQGLIPSAQRKVELELGTTEEAVSDLRGSA